MDLVAFGLDDDGTRPLLALGEVKWGTPWGRGHIDRLVRVRELLIAQGRSGAQDARLLFVSAAGFTTTCAIGPRTIPGSS